VFVACDVYYVARLAEKDPVLFEQRTSTTTIQEGQSLADKILASSTVGLPFIALITLAFERASKGAAATTVPVWLQGVGALLHVAGRAGGCWALESNTFAICAVKEQKNRNQKVISSGPYAYVRHPFYAINVLCVIGGSLLLGSFTGLWFAVAVGVVCAVRIEFEEKFLVKNLKGYNAYAQRVKYRMIPGVF
jgi:protein-S-isoprenylcysteine O-methyltransferase Ste14